MIDNEVFSSVITDGNSLYIYGDCDYELMPNGHQESRVDGSVKKKQGVIRLGPFFVRTSVKINSKPNMVRIEAGIFNVDQVRRASVSNIEELRLFEPSSDGECVNLICHTAGISGGGIFRYVKECIEDDDDGFVIVTTLGRRWKRDSVYPTPEMYGASSNENAIATKFIQKIIDLMPNDKGGILCLNNRKYTHTGISWNGKNNVSIIGAGWGSELHNSSTDGSHNIHIIGDNIDVRSYGIQLSNFSVTGNGQSGVGIQVDSGGYYDTSGRESSVTTLNHLNINSNGLDGIVIGGAGALSGAGNSVRIADCLIKNNLRSGIRIRNHSNLVGISGCTVANNAQDGVELNQIASTCTVRENSIFDNGRYGVYCFRAEEPLIILNGFNRNAKGAIALSGDPSGSVKYTEAALVQGNLFGDNGSSGEKREISVYASTGCNIKDNYFYAAGQDCMIYISDYVKGLVIQGNHWKNLTTERKVVIKDRANNTNFVFNDNAREDDLTQTINHNKISQTIIKASSTLKRTKISEGHANSMFEQLGDGSMMFGGGEDSHDVKIYRSSAGVIKISDCGHNDSASINVLSLDISKASSPSVKPGITQIYISSDGSISAMNGDGKISQIVSF